MAVYNPKIVFFGTPEFSVKILEAMKKAGFTPLLIVTSPDKPAGRGKKITPPPVKIWAQKNKIEVLQPTNLKEKIYKLKAKRYQLFIVASYGKILPKEILEIPAYGTLNVHPSLLPKLRGPSPIQTAILNGEEKTGVTIMLMNERMDEGPILSISNLKSQISNLSYKELEDELAKLGGELLVKTIPKWLAGEIKPKPQEESKATYTKIITKKDGQINWNEPAEVIERKIRAFTPWPGAYTFFKNKRIIITKAKLEKGALKIERVKPEGKNEIDFKQFLSANPDFLNHLAPLGSPLGSSASKYFQVLPPSKK